MNIEDVITLDDGKEYVILDIAELDGKKYIYSVEIDKEEEPTTNYKFFEWGKENNEEFLVEVVNQEVLNRILAIFTANYLNTKDDEQAV